MKMRRNDLSADSFVNNMNQHMYHKEKDPKEFDTSPIKWYF